MNFMGSISMGLFELGVSFPALNVDHPIDIDGKQVYITNKEGVLSHKQRLHDAQESGNLSSHSASATPLPCDFEL